MSKFQFKNFDVDDCGCGMKICSDSVLLAAWTCRGHNPCGTVADVGTGSGVIALLLASRWPKATIVGSENQPPAARAARFNFAASPWAGRMEVFDGDFADYTPPGPLAAVVSNPPYFPEGIQSPDADRARARHQGSLTYSSLMDYAMAHLGPEGFLATVSPVENEPAILEASVFRGLHLRRQCRVRTTASRPPRLVLWEWVKSPCDCTVSELTIRRDGKYTTEYLDLVSEFYHHLSQ